MPVLGFGCAITWSWSHIQNTSAWIGIWLLSQLVDHASVYPPDINSNHLNPHIFLVYKPKPSSKSSSESPASSTSKLHVRLYCCDQWSPILFGCAHNQSQPVSIAHLWLWMLLGLSMWFVPELHPIYQYYRASQGQAGRSPHWVPARMCQLGDHKWKSALSAHSRLLSHHHHVGLWESWWLLHTKSLKQFSRRKINHQNNNKILGCMTCLFWLLICVRPLNSGKNLHHCISASFPKQAWPVVAMKWFEGIILAPQAQKSPV